LFDYIIQQGEELRFPSPIKLPEAATRKFNKSGRKSSFKGEEKGKLRLTRKYMVLERLNIKWPGRLEKTQI
jgi:hypothetical protein